MKKFLCPLGAAASLFAAAAVLVPVDASAYWRGGWRGPGWGLRVAALPGYRPLYGPWVYGALAGAALVPPVVLVPPPVVIGYPLPVYPAPYGPLGGYYGYGYGPGPPCVTDDGYGVYRSCNR